LIETVKRFKGLEAEVVFLWTLPESNSAEFAEVVYVGATRACADLTIVATSSELAGLKL
jgi:superfamily I DNA/RNA helicase